MGKRGLHIALVLACGLSALVGTSQESSSAKPFAIYSKAHYGYILPHRSGMKNLIKGRVGGFELNYLQPTFGEKDWHATTNFADWGVSFYYADLGNQLQFGSAIGLYPFFNFPIIQNKRLRVNYRIGTGLGYITEKWHRTENYKNIVIGSHFNGVIAMHGELELKLSKRLRWHTGLAFTHYSNGAITAPNLGINIPSVNSGFSLWLGDMDYAKLTTEKPELNKHWELWTIGAIGIRQDLPAEGRRHFAALGGLNATYAFSRISHVQGQLDLYWNSSLIDRMENDTTVVSPVSIVQPGLMVLYEASVGNWSILVGKGAYVYSKYKGDGLFYHRIGSRYRINDKLLVNMTLKTHWFKADFIEMGLGYRLK